MSNKPQEPEKSQPEEESQQPQTPPEPEGGPFERERQFLQERMGPMGPKEKSAPHPPDEESEPEGGPFERERQFLQERITRIRPKDEIASDAEPTLLPTPPEPGPREETPFNSLPSEALSEAAKSRRRALEEFRRLRLEKLRSGRSEEPPEPPPGRPGFMGPREVPVPPPADNWIPIGPSILRQGQGGVKPAVSGRTPAIAVAPGGTRIYAGAANGGVWRSDDTGETWRSLMDAFDRNPTSYGSDSLAVGAIVIDPANPDRIFVGTGEGDAAAYFGVGPVVSLDGGNTWNPPETLPGGNPWFGSCFYALAMDPGNPDRIVSGGRQGLHRREPDGIGGFHWVPKSLPGVASIFWVTSVVAAQTGGVTTFYAAPWFGPVFSSPDGDTWTRVGVGFPTFNVGRISLAVQPNNPSVIYALVATTGAPGSGTAANHLLGVYRLDTSDGIWRPVFGAPSTLFGANPYSTGQGFYDSAIAIAPDNVNRIYLGGSTVYSDGEFPDVPFDFNHDYSGSLYRCEVTVSEMGVSMVPTYIGGSVHADIHALVFAPGDPNKLWVGCDGGVFYSTNPTGSGRIFTARNTGLQTLTMNHLGQHPTEEAVLFAGTQDNGGERFTGEEAWLYSASGDAGFVVVNWMDPYKVLITYTGASISRSLSGGTRKLYRYVGVPLAWNEQESALFYAPLAGTPPNPDSPTAAADADLVAFGSIRPWISTNFGDEWHSIPTDTLEGDRLDQLIRSLVFASPSRLYVGTTNGGVYRYDRSGDTWTRTRIDMLGEVHPFGGIVTDIAVDPSNADRIYITFGGYGDYRRVWFFDGTQWEPRSGPVVGDADSLSSVQANAIIVDPIDPAHLYVGTDIGVWRSTNSGATWEPFSEGLPDAAIIDMVLHNPRRLLRASTHGRGVWERNLSDGPRLGIELYIRGTQLDQGRVPIVDGLDDPTGPGRRVYHWAGPDIKLDTPTVMGQYQLPLNGMVDFHQFVDKLSDYPEMVLSHATHSTPATTTRVYVQVHNRGVLPANEVRVMLLLANTSAALPALPAGYSINVRTGIPINTANWHTVGLVTLNDVRVGMPKIATFDLTSNLLPPPANLADNNHQCILALIHHPDDQYASLITNTDHNSLTERKAAHKNMRLVQFIGTLPDPPPVIIPFRIHNADLEQEIRTNIHFIIGSNFDSARLYSSALNTVQPLEQSIHGLRIDNDFEPFQRWAEEHVRMIRENLESNTPYDREWSLQRIDDIERVSANGLMFKVEAETAPVEIHGIQMEPDSYRTFFLVLERPRDGEPGQDYTIEIIQTDENQNEIIGGLRIRVELVLEPGT